MRIQVGVGVIGSGQWRSIEEDDSIEQRPFDSRAVMGFSVLNGIFIGLLNLSIGFNSVGFYQVLGMSNFDASRSIDQWYGVDLGF
ncbi:hypothetical protein M8C21_001313 [Ambrosia artemisiifolia]|uniref:Uncharacterized protein n=1 Tax=Ambrosia artemisiifolia TaxID=4212 RepID=A0AAD5G5P4_AMBAR|nr:hypothetical protein M8C21_001313 [Ambrosia artemisiifolia]